MSDLILDGSFGRIKGSKFRFMTHQEFKDIHGADAYVRFSVQDRDMVQAYFKKPGSPEIPSYFEFKDNIGQGEVEMNSPRQRGHLGYMILVDQQDKVLDPKLHAILTQKDLPLDAPKPVHEQINSNDSEQE